MTFQEEILQGIPAQLPPKALYDATINHAPKRKEILSAEEKTLALRNALRYFEPQHHETLIPEYKEELEKSGFPVTDCELREVVRQKTESGILTNATQLRERLFSDNWQGGFFSLRMDDFKDIAMFDELNSRNVFDAFRELEFYDEE